MCGLQFLEFTSHLKSAEVKNAGLALKLHKIALEASGHIDYFEERLYFPAGKIYIVK